MYNSEYEEEVRKLAVMAEVLPDADMWRKWEKTEAPLRQGRGWYPALDRHFLELLVVSEIQTLSHPLHSMATAAGTAERIHRHASRVRRVACERIGAERLHAYCERVREAFDAYVHGPWGGAPPSQEGPEDIHDEIDDELDVSSDDDDDHDIKDEPSESQRGRVASRRDMSNTSRSELPHRAVTLSTDQPGSGRKGSPPNRRQSPSPPRTEIRALAVSPDVLDDPWDVEGAMVSIDLDLADLDELDENDDTEDDDVDVEINSSATTVGSSTLSVGSCGGLSLRFPAAERMEVDLLVEEDRAQKLIPV